MIHIKANYLSDAYKKTFLSLMRQTAYDDAEIYKETVALIEINSQNDNLQIKNNKLVFNKDYSKQFPYIDKKLINREIKYWENSFIKNNSLKEIISYLKKDPLTKRAIILFWKDRYRNMNGKSVCEIACFFRKKNENLEMNTMMRANNASFLLYMDMDILTSVHKIIADALNLKVGKYIHFINSLHFYKNELNIIKKQQNLLKQL